MTRCLQGRVEIASPSLFLDTYSQSAVFSIIYNNLHPSRRHRHWRWMLGMLGKKEMTTLSCCSPLCCWHTGSWLKQDEGDRRQSGFTVIFRYEQHFQLDFMTQEKYLSTVFIHSAEELTQNHGKRENTEAGWIYYCSPTSKHPFVYLLTIIVQKNNSTNTVMIARTKSASKWSD